MCRVLCLCDRLQGNVILPCMCIVSYIRLCVPHTCFMRWVPCAVFVCSGSNPAKIGATPHPDRPQGNVMLKVKDWPPEDDFKAVMDRHNRVGLERVCVCACTRVCLCCWCACV